MSQVPPAPRGAMPKPGTSPGGAERRAHPRHPVDWVAWTEWRGGPAAEGRLHDISHGGARLVGVAPQAIGSLGTLRIEGIALPVPCRVVGFSAPANLHIAFDLEGMGRDAFLAQLDRQLAQAR